MTIYQVKLLMLKCIQKLQNVSAIPKHLTTEGLVGAARERFRNEARDDFENVTANNELVKFLFINLNGNQFADKLITSYSNFYKIVLSIS